MTISLQMPLLRHSADCRSLVLLALLVSGYLGHWFGGSGAHWLLIPCVLLAISACVVKHNHIHHATFQNPLLNRAFNVWLAILTGTSTTGIRIAHNQRHHRNSQSPEDFVRCSLVQQKSAFSALLSFFPLVVLQTWAHAEQDAMSMRRKSAPLRALLRLERMLLWSFVVVALILDWQQFLWVFPVPWLVSQWFLVTINLLQHDGLETGDPLLESRNVVGLCSNWIFLNNGYHTAHHLRPALHWSLLRSYHDRELASRLPDQLVAKSLVALLFDWLKTRSRRHTPVEITTACTL
jgi:beta-carotene hydroxylase